MKKQYLNSEPILAAVLPLNLGADIVIMCPEDALEK
jgi:hypothetical protein